MAKNKKKQKKVAVKEKKVPKKRSYVVTDGLFFNGTWISSNEIQLIDFICQELTNQEIASITKRTARTVEGLRLIVMKKTKSKNMISLFKYAVKHGIFEFKTG